MLRRVDREQRERDEVETLAPGAARSGDARRAEPEDPDPLRTAWERDRDRVLHSKAFRRLKHKTQVFINPDGDHIVTRLTHTLQVAQIGRALARALGLNEPLAEAICLAHDIGHSPFGHTGEEALSPYAVQLQSPHGEWLHSVQSVRVLSKLEPLNLTEQVLDGVRAHSWKIDPPPMTLEGMCCRFADRIAYLAHDALDSMRAGVLGAADFPDECLTVLGDPGRDWIHTMVMGVVDGSSGRDEVAMDPVVLDAMHTLRAFMFERVYLRDEARRQGDKAIKIIRELVDWFAAHPDEIASSYARPADPPLQRAMDHVAGMSDDFAVAAHDALFRPAW